MCFCGWQLQQAQTFTEQPVDEWQEDEDNKDQIRPVLTAHGKAMFKDFRNLSQYQPTIEPMAKATEWSDIKAFLHRRPERSDKPHQ